MPDINPEEFGRMKQQIDQLQKSQDALAKDMKEILAVINQSKGGFYASMALAAFISSIVTIFIKQWIN